MPCPRVDAVAGVDDLALVLLASLAAMGITFSAADGIAATAEWVVDSFESFVDSTGDAIEDVFSRIRYGITSSGQLAVNAYGADRIGVFARDLANTYSLSSNSTQVLSTSSRLGYAYAPFTVGTFTNTSGNPNRSPVNKANSGDSYVCAIFNSSYPTAVNFLSFSSVSQSAAQLSSPLASAVLNESFVVDSVTWYGSSVYVTDVFGGNSSGAYSVYSPAVSLIVSYRPRVLNFTDQGQITPLIREVMTMLGLLSPDTGSSVTATTGTLDIPQVGDYDDDDGLLIDGIGSWGDTLQDIWDKISGWSIPDQPVPAISYDYAASDELAGELVNEVELTTENSPLILWPGGSFSYNFSFSSIWHYVTDWVSSMSAGLALTGSIMFSLPFVGVWYAVVVLIIVLSLWRLLKHA